MIYNNNNSLDELVKDNKNGLVFTDSQDLYEQWMVMLYIIQLINYFTEFILL